MKDRHWHVLPDAQTVAETVARRITELAQAAIDERGSFRIVLAGGTTPEKVYEQLSASDSDWTAWHIYYGDERCLPVEHPDRNSVMARKAWLDHAPIPAEQIHTIPAELGPEKAALAYERIVARALPFDLVLLGMGEDGHTASLFPGHHHEAGRLALPVFGAPKPPPERVTLSLEALNDSHAVIILVTGAAKSHAVQEWQAGADLPIAAIHGRHGCDIYMDSAARP